MSRVWCWFCKKMITPSDCCDATCKKCDRPYDRSRHDEFHFDYDGKKRKQKGRVRRYFQ